MSYLAPTGVDGGSTSGSGILPKIPSTNTSALPINTAIHLKSKTDSLEKFSIPFSYQFTFRYLFGMDLEFGDELIKRVLGNVKDKADLPKYIIPITIKPGKKGEKESKFRYEPNVNRDFFAEITDTSRFDEK